MSVIDTGTNTVTRTLPVGDWPYDVAATDDGRFVYVVNRADHTVSVINDASDTVTSIPVGEPCACERGFFNHVAVSPDGSRVYATRDHQDEWGNYFGTIVAIDTATKTMAGYTVTPWLSDLQVTPDGTRIYAAQIDYRNFMVFDAATLAQIGTVGVTTTASTTHVNSIAISPDGTRAYAVVNYDFTGTEADSVSVIDTNPMNVATYNKEIATIKVPRGAQIACRARTEAAPTSPIGTANRSR